MKKCLKLTILTVLSVFSVGCTNNAKTSESLSQTSDSVVETMSDIKTEDTTVRIAVYGGIQAFLDKYIDQFNKEDNGYIIELKDYREYADETMEDRFAGYDLADMRLNTDIIKGNVVDVICNASFYNAGYYDIMQNKGAFVDLYTLMEKDDEFTISDYNEHILSLFEIDGKLYKMPVFYMINTMIGTKRFIGDRLRWNTQGLIDCYNSIDETVTFNLNTDNMHVFNTLIRGNLSSFIDYQNAAVRFDSPDFIKMLDFCGSFENGSRLANDVDCDSALFVMEKTFSSFTDYHNTLFEFHQRGEECTVIGYPSPDGNGAFIDDINGAFSICNTASDDVKQGAWEFIKYIISENTQNEILENVDEIGFPINNNSYRFLAEGSMGIGENLVSMNGEIIDIGYLSEDEFAQITDYINKTNNVKTTAYKDLNSLILDEVTDFFGGEKSAEETVRLIQNRASIMISEMS